MIQKWMLKMAVYSKSKGIYFIIYYSFSRLLIKHISWNYASFLQNSKHKS